MSPEQPKPPKTPKQIWEELFEHFQQAREELAEQGVDLTCEFKLQGMPPKQDLKE